MNKSTETLDINQVFLSRRQFMKIGLGLFTGFAGMNIFSFAAELQPFKVVVVGGGFGGATAAKYLKLWGKELVEVILVEPNVKYNSPILSGMVVTHQLEIDRLDFGYDRLSTVHGINIIKDRVASIDSASKTVSLDGGSTLSYDRLILSPGIDFVDVEGWDPLKLPHAWSGRDQLSLLTEQLANFPKNGTFVINVPAGPYRCPPATYERASTVADYLQVNNKNARVVVLDIQSDISINPTLFHELFEEFGVEYRSNIQIQHVNSGDNAGNGRSITFVELIKDADGAVIGQNNIETIEAAVINLIPDHKAASLIFDADLNEGNWAPVDPLTYESTIAGKEFIHILGDSQGTAQVKAGQSANAQAKVCADAILRILAGQEPYGIPITTVGCSALVTQTRANWAGNTWRYNPNTLLMEKDKANAAADPSEANHEIMLKWANNLFADTFG